MTATKIGSELSPFYMQQRFSHSVAFLGIATCCSMTPAMGDTYSNVVVDVRMEISNASTRAIAFPVSEAFTGASGFVGDTLASAVDSNDLIHMWLDKYFLTYEFSAETGYWRIRESDSRMPDGRLQHVLGDGYMLTRRAVGTALVSYTGAAPGEPSLTVSVPAMEWQLIGIPFPTSVDGDRIVDAGAQPGDNVKIWDPAESTWKTHVLTETGWEVDGIPGDLTVGFAEAFLYYNGSSETRNLIFARPYAAETRP